MNAPVHTDVTYRAVLACRRTNSMVSSSPSASITPLYPPGTQIKSRSGQFSKVCVGMRLRPLSLGTGSLLLATMCIAESQDPGRGEQAPIHAGGGYRAGHGGRDRLGADARRVKLDKVVAPWTAAAMAEAVG